MNRSLYWFNPLAWWLERRLAALAEEACDDAALLALGQRESYAQALLDMAAAVKTGQGRLVWDAMAMAKGKEVRMRIERILDDSRQIPRGLTRSRWLMLVAASLPLIYLSAALRPVPAAARDQTPAAIAGLLQHHPTLTAGDAAQLEQYLITDPNDLAAREKLVLYYFSTGVREPRLSHIYWLIANHPESNEAAITSQGITPRATQFNTTADYERAAALWQQQAAAHPNDAAVLTHAGTFFAQPGGDPNEAERLFLQVHAIDPLEGEGPLAKLYATAILGTFGDPKYPDDNPDFGNRVRSQIESSTDGMLLELTGATLAGGGVTLRTREGATFHSGAVNYDEHPLLAPARDLGKRLMELAPKFLALAERGPAECRGCATRPVVIDDGHARNPRAQPKSTYAAVFLRAGGLSAIARHAVGAHGGIERASHLSAAGQNGADSGNRQPGGGHIPRWPHHQSHRAARTSFADPGGDRGRQAMGLPAGFASQRL